MSAAFDTLDQMFSTKECTLHSESPDTLKWFSLNLSDRHQSVAVHLLMSRPLSLKYGVPRGSPLGPVLFAQYTQTLSDVIDQCSCNYHKYADDTQLDDCCAFLSPKSWMLCNRLRLNDGKSEVMCSGLWYTFALTSEACWMVGASKIQFCLILSKLLVHILTPLCRYINKSPMFVKLPALNWEQKCFCRVIPH